MTQNKEKNDEVKKNPFQDTLNLPHTEFPIRANAATKEIELLQRWETEKISETTLNNAADKKSFVLHDGPPYANGNIHLGHALNKILKDIVCKINRMKGKYVPFVPGWDCHGLPIELKVTTEQGTEGKRKENKGITEEERAERVAFKKQCRAYAQQWIEKQKEEFKGLGIFGDWNNPYITMAPTYEASILEAFADFVEKGFITRKGKTISWCASCQTVLATAEIEYKDRKDPSTYILFPLSKETTKETFPFLVEHHKDIEVNFLIWTTTPWTIPLNRAVVLHPTAPYVVLQGKEANQAFIVAKDLADKICTLVGIEKRELAEFDPIVFKGKKVRHPFIDNEVPLILDDSVLLSDGTACVHSAPGCGPDDYLLGIKNGLEIYSPLSVDGKYLKGILPAELEGTSITDGQIWVMRKLAEVGRLFFKNNITHAYPHCWRCHNGLMFRATDQWFCDLNKHDLTTKAVEAVEATSFVPDWGQTRLRSFVENRSEWCISRQRQWGTPIPAILCKGCSWTLMDANFIRGVASHVATDGIEFWDSMTMSELQRIGLLPKDFACGDCKSSDMSKFVLERDILDVWFDSGVSHYAVLKKNKLLTMPADMYLEGSDQHRGWFQSALLSAVVMHDVSPTKLFLTHGFLVDEKGYKMSKSLGNGVEPNDVIKNYSRDILRLWVASTDYSGDVVISDKVLKNTAEVYRKIRNTFRFMASNLYDFDSKQDSVPFEDMLLLDQYILRQLNVAQAEVLQAYNEYHFASAVQIVNNFCVNNLSAMYLDILKDRLYIEAPKSLLRRSGQTALHHMLTVLTRLMAPVLSFLSEEVSDYYEKNKTQSVHLDQFSEVSVLLEYDKEGWELLDAIRTVMLKAIEDKRQAGVVKHSLEAKVSLLIDSGSVEGSKLLAFMETVKAREDVVRFFKDWFIVSQVEFDIHSSLKVHAAHVSEEGRQCEDCAQVAKSSWLTVMANHADGEKCQRCWQWHTSGDAQLCGRCKLIVG